MLLQDRRCILFYFLSVKGIDVSEEMEIESGGWDETKEKAAEVLA